MTTDSDNIGDAYLYSARQRSRRRNLEALLISNVVRQIPIPHCFDLPKTTRGHTALHELCLRLRQKIPGANVLHTYVKHAVKRGLLVSDKLRP